MGGFGGNEMCVTAMLFVSVLLVIAGVACDSGGSGVAVSFAWLGWEAVVVAVAVYA